jgi:hypothetical protein
MCQVGDHSRRIGFSHIYNILTCTNNYNHNSYSMKIWHVSTIDNEQTIVTIVRIVIHVLPLIFYSYISKHCSVKLIFINVFL